MKDAPLFPIRLTGEKIELREFRSDDLDAMLPVVGDDQVTHWLSFDTRTRDQAAAMLQGALERAQLEPRTEFYLGVTERGVDELVGFARLGFDGVQAAKLGYAIRADRWGRGYATDAARTLTSFGFRELGLHRISAAIGPDNAASIAVVKRLGYAYEGRIRDHVHTNGAWRDSLLYSVLAEEWRGAGRSVAA
jgi:RimJ/RimL family protein N-acetyltransferase